MEENKSLTIFNFQKQEVRITIIDGTPWFAAIDACKILDIKDAKQAIERLDSDERGWYSIPTPGGNQQVNCVNEPGLYRLIFRSDKPQAKAFQHWVYHEVLPSIHKTGIYAVPGLALTDIETALTTLTDLQTVIRSNKNALRHIGRKAGILAAPHYPTKSHEELSVRKAILKYVKHLTTINKPPTLRDLARYITRVPPEIIQKYLDILVNEGFLIENISGRSPRYELA